MIKSEKETRKKGENVEGGRMERREGQDEEKDESDTRVGIYISQDIARVAAASGCLPGRRLSSMWRVTRPFALV